MRSAGAQSTSTLRGPSLPTAPPLSPSGAGRDLSPHSGRSGLRFGFLPDSRGLGRGGTMGLRRLSLFSALALGLAVSPGLAQSPRKVLRVVPSADVAELDPTRAANQIGRI